MKKKLSVLTVAVIVLLMAAGCGSNGGSADGENSDSGSKAQAGPAMMEIGPKTLSAEEENIIKMAGVEEESTGLLQYQADESVKSIKLKVMDYDFKTKKWESLDDVHVSADAKDISAGEIMAYYVDQGRLFRAQISFDEDERLTGHLGSTSKVFGNTMDAGDRVFETSEIKMKDVAKIEVNKDIPIHMMGIKSSEDESKIELRLSDYSDPEALKDYLELRAIVVEFSSEEK